MPPCALDIQAPCCHAEAAELPRHAACPNAAAAAAAAGSDEIPKAEPQTATDIDDVGTLEGSVVVAVAKWSKACKQYLKLPLQDVPVTIIHSGVDDELDDLLIERFQIDGDFPAFLFVDLTGTVHQAESFEDAIELAKARPAVDSPCITVLYVDGICCRAEVPIIEKALGALAGVSRITIDIPGQTTTVEHASTTPAELLLLALN